MANLKIIFIILGILLVVLITGGVTFLITHQKKKPIVCNKNQHIVNGKCVDLCLDKNEVYSPALKQCICKPGWRKGADKKCTQKINYGKCYVDIGGNIIQNECSSDYEITQSQCDSKTGRYCQCASSTQSGCGQNFGAKCIAKGFDCVNKKCVPVDFQETKTPQYNLYTDCTAHC